MPYEKILLMEQKILSERQKVDSRVALLNSIKVMLCELNIEEERPNIQDIHQLLALISDLKGGPLTLEEKEILKEIFSLTSTQWKKDKS